MTEPVITEREWELARKFYSVLEKEQPPLGEGVIAAAVFMSAVATAFYEVQGVSDPGLKAKKLFEMITMEMAEVMLEAKRRKELSLLSLLPATPFGDGKTWMGGREPEVDGQ